MCWLEKVFGKQNHHHHPEGLWEPLMGLHVVPQWTGLPMKINKGTLSALLAVLLWKNGPFT